MALAQPPRQLRHCLAALLPPWAGGSVARPKAHSFTVEGVFTIYDLDAELMWQSLLSRFPSTAPEDALPYLLRDKRMIAGPAEPIATTRVRLKQWIDEWSLAGLPLGLMLALQAYVAPSYPRIRIVTRRSMWYTLEAGAVPRLLNLPGAEPLPPCPYELGAGWPIGAVASQVERLRAAGLYQRYKAPVPNWNWDSISDPAAANRWWDSWVFIYPPSYPFQGNYDGVPPDDVYYGEETGWGIDELPGTLLTLQQLAVLRKSQKSYIKAIILPPSLTDFDPTTPPGDPSFPDGKWSWFTKDDGLGNTVPARRQDCRYILDIAQ